MQRHGATVASILERLVAFDTTSHKTNIPLILYVEDYLREHGVASYLVPTDDGQKASLFATIGPDHAGGIALSGHTDVVPVEGQSWDTDPFTLTLKDNRYYGRGTSDMKGFLACVLAAVPRFKAKPLAKPIHIAFSYDEEIGCLGVRPMIAELGTRLPMPRVVIVGEPTEMRVVDAHKGPVRWQVDIDGRAAHSSMAHLGVNAITYAGMILGELQHIERDLKASLQDPRFEPPYPTLQVTTIEGGTASNIVPVSCRFGFEIRAMPGLDITAVEQRLTHFIETVCLPQMKTTAPEARITVTRKNHVPPFGSTEGSEAVALALALAGHNETFAVSYATEAGLFQDAGAPSVVCGPGSIAQAHTANEWIAVSELEKCLSFMDRLADWCAA
jgi:acetylornithine deacetylase